MTFTVRFTQRAELDLIRLYQFLIDREDPDLLVAELALDAIRTGIEGLESNPLKYRKVTTTPPFMRELVIPFGKSGYVALFDIDDNRTVTISAIKHQRERGYSDLPCLK